MPFPLDITSRVLYSKGMAKQRMTITSHRNSTIGRLTAHDPDTGATLYQVDGPYQGRYRVLGLRSEYLAAHSRVDSLAHARETMRLDVARLSRASR